MQDMFRSYSAFSVQDIFVTYSESRTYSGHIQSPGHIQDIFRVQDIFGTDSGHIWDLFILRDQVSITGKIKKLRAMDFEYWL